MALRASLLTPKGVSTSKKVRSARAPSARKEAREHKQEDEQSKEGDKAKRRITLFFLEQNKGNGKKRMEEQ